MKCYCYETEIEFIFCVEEADIKFEDNLQTAWWERSGKKFIKVYPKEFGDDVDAEDKEIIKRNFARLGQSMFEGIFDWKKVLLLLAQTFSDNGIEWYIIGSTSEAVLGVNINPHDIDIIVHTRDFYKVKKIFPDYVVEPFVDNKGSWVVRYFGRLCIDGAIVDIAADEKMNLENHQHQYDKVSWNDYDIFIEPLQVRHQTELERNREERIMAIEEFIKDIN